MGYHLVLRKWHVDTLDFSRSSFWMRVFGVPLTMSSNENCECIGALLGDLQEIDIRGNGGSYFRMKVAIDLLLLLCPGTQIKTKDCVDK